ncbi:uncharacterized protein LOC143021758 [Oratosquilla oratoria]|uniref:uncharacterized protein LOC143021758 n=1 Tax=Oratosquilla oratoria TaxID=337810 RepID=UPI003F762A09
MVTPVPELPIKVKKMKEKKTKKNKKERKKKKHKRKKKEEFGFDSDNDDLDLSKELRPLADFADDPDELLNQIFSTIKGSKLTNMLPPVLRSLSVKELKKFCLHELEGMSHKRIVCIINGEVLEDSSEEEEEDEDLTEKTEKIKMEQEKNGKEEGAVKSKRNGEKAAKDAENDPESLKDGKKDGKTSLDILELEMRAKIIKTMLERQGTNEARTPEEVKALEEEVIAEERKKMLAEAKRKMEEEDLNESKRSKKDVPQDEKPRQQNVGESSRDASRRRRKRRSEYRRHESRDEGRKKEMKEEVPKKRKKITRREFEERMKKAKQNRTYRRRRNSEEEEEQEKARELMEEQMAKEKNAEKMHPDGVTGEPKEPTEEGEAVDSEKEEGEIDSEEEHEEGSCSPSDISSGSDFSYDSRTGSRKRSYSYSHSSRSDSYSSRSSQSCSRSPSPGPRRQRQRSRSGSYGSRGRRSYPRRGGKLPSRVMSQGIVRTVEGRASIKSNKDDEEDNWGEKCDIEFIDSGDEKSKTESKVASRLKLKPTNQFEKVGISFAIQKKPSHSITNTLVLEDYLPPVRSELPASNLKSTTGELALLGKAKRIKKPEAPKGENQVVVISDSDSEEGKRQSVEAPEMSSVAEVSEEDMSKKNIQKIKTTISKELENEFVATEEEAAQGKGKEETLSENKDVVASETENEKTCENEEPPKMATDPTCDLDQVNENKEAVLENKTEDDPQVAEEAMDKTEPDGEAKAESITDGEMQQGGSDIIPPPAEQEGSEACPEEAQSKEEEDLGNSGNTEDEHTQELVTEAGEKVQSIIPVTETDRAQAETRDETSDRSPPVIHEKDTEDQREPAASKAEDTVGMVTNKGNPSETTGETLQNDSGGQSIVQQDSEALDLSKNSENQPMVCDTEGLVVNAERQPCTPISVITDQGNDEEVTTDGQDTSAAQPNDNKEQKDEKVRKPKMAAVDNPEDFYRGAEDLEYPEEREEDEEEELQKLRNAHVEPIRIESGLVRRRVVKTEKAPLEPPLKSWLAKEKKKKEKSVEILALEGVGLLKSALMENQASASSESAVTDAAKNEPPETEGPSTGEKKDLAKDDAETKVPEEKGEAILQDLEPEELQDFPDDFSVERSTTSEAKRGKDMEIIGVIEPTDSSGGNVGDLDLGGSSWSMRWLQSEKVQKVVTNSKMLSRVRKKIQRKEKEKDTKTNKPSVPDLPKQQPTPEIPVIGSIEEYERLFGLKSKKIEPAAPEPPEQKIIPVAPAPSAIPKLESDESEEDSEEEALWSKIMKK